MCYYHMGVNDTEKNLTMLAEMGFFFASRQKNTKDLLNTKTTCSKVSNKYESYLSNNCQINH